MRLVKTAKASPHAKFYNLGTDYKTSIKSLINGNDVTKALNPEFIFITLPSKVESRTQGSRPRPRPRTQNKAEAKAKAKDSLSEDRTSRGQGQECSRPRPRTKDTSASALQKKGLLQKFFKRSPQKNVFQKNFQALHKILTIQKIVLSSSRGQANFRGLEASRPRPRPRT